MYNVISVVTTLAQKTLNQPFSFVSISDTLAEWLRRRPAKPLGFAREGSNPSGVVFCLFETNSLFVVGRLQKLKKVIHSRFVRVILAQGPC